jgi:hypothetical protein
MFCRAAMYSAFPATTAPPRFPSAAKFLAEAFKSAPKYNNRLTPLAPMASAQCPERAAVQKTGRP